MVTISVDVGYSYTKTHKQLIFPTKIHQGGDLLLGPEIEYKGKKYGVGFGMGEMELNKVNSDITKICMLYALCRSTNDNEINLITGLPIAQYASQKQAIRAEFLGDSDVIIDGKERRLSIKDVKVFPQGAGALYSADIQGDAILCDIGGRTVDIAMFQMSGGKRRLEKFTTIYSGLIQLYSKIAMELNNRYTLSLTTDDAEKAIKYGLRINEKEQDITFLRDIIYEHTYELRNEIKVNYPEKTTKIILCGGGAYLYSKVLGYSRLDNSQFANAIGFYRMGGSIG